MKYGVRLQGKNYELMFEEGKQLCGFITTRFVKAKSPQEAELKAVDLIRKDVHLNRLMVPGTSLISTITLTEIWQEKWWKRIGGKGYTFYPMDESDEI